MKKFLQHQKSLFAFLLVLCLGMGTTYAYDFSKTYSGKTFYFNIINSAQRYVEITYPGEGAWASWEGFTKPTGSITLPSTVTYNSVTYTVTKIGDYAFYECDGLTGSLTIPNTVTTIGRNAFYGCSGFNGNLTIPNSVTTIGDSAFGWCPNFTGSLTIPNSVTYLGSYAFYNSGFTGSLTIGNSLPSIGECAFSFCDFTGTLTIGSSVTSIGRSAFHACHGFTGSLVIPDSVTTIDEWAFYDCSGLTGSLTLGNSLTTIGNRAFWSDRFTGSLTIPNSVTTIGDLAFCWNTGFNGTLTIGTGVTSIGESAFEICSGFTEVKFNAINCADVTDEDKPFEGCGGTLTIGSTVARIPAYMFYQCSGFTGSLYIQSSVTTIGEGAFYGCSGFTSSLTFGNSVTTIGDYAFRDCTGFTGSLNIPNSVTTIGTAAFANCSGFTGTLTISNSVTTIGTSAFSTCTNFTGLILGNSVTALGIGAFFYCINLSSITVLPETPPALGINAFYDVPTTIPVYVPCGSMNVYQSTGAWTEFTNYQCNPEVTVTAVPTTGGTVTGGGTYTYGTSCTVTATPSSGYRFMHWSKNGTVVSCNDSYTFTANQDVDLEAVFVSLSYLGDIIGSGTNASEYLPSHSYYRYSLSEQIYTASEIGGSTTINTISFFNAGTTKTRNYDIYMKLTTKTSFSSNTDWISVTSSNMVFSGSVTMRAGMWTTIVLDTPFAYNGTSNLVLVVDDNTGNFSSGMMCRTYATSGNQAIRIYSDGTNYNPYSPSSYTGTCMTEKNQIILNRLAYDITATSANTSEGTVSGGGTYSEGDLCRLKATAKSGYVFRAWKDESDMIVSTDANYSFIVREDKILTASFCSDEDHCYLTFNLHDSYGDGWNGNQLVVNYPNGMSEKLAVPLDNHEATLTLPIPDGYIELGWIASAYIYECSFEVCYSDGNLLYAGRNLDESFEYGFEMDCAGQSAGWVYVGDHSMAKNNFLPSYSYYKYGLSEQIYTAEEIGTSGIINGIAFYNDGETKTRTYNIYLKTTDKTEFASRTDWVNASVSDKVYSGTVTMVSGAWTPIIFNAPFEYNGVSNLVLIVDDNTGDYTSLPSMACRIYETQGVQAIRIYSDYTDFLPSSSSMSNYSGTLQNVKNQIMLDITPAPCSKPFDLDVVDITYTSAGIKWKVIGEENIVCDFEDGTFPDGWTTIDADGDGYNWEVNTQWGAHDGSTGMIQSSSYTNGTVLYPDNYLVSPQIQLGGSISFWACAQDAGYAAEHFGVAVSTTGNTNASDFTTIQEWTMTAKGTGAKVNPETTRSGNRWQGTWYLYTVNLSAYAGQMGYVAIRHFNCSDMFYINVDDIEILLNENNNDYEIQYRESTPDNDFEGGFLQWTTIDADGDGYDWVLGTNTSGIYYSNLNLTGYGHHTSNDVAVSGSYSQVAGAMTPDNYLVSPQIQLGGSFSFWACAIDASYAAEHFGVAVSTTGNTNASDFTTIQEWTLTAKGTGAKVNPEMTRSGSRSQGTWYQYSVDLTAYAGQTGYVAIRHFNCSDEFLLLVDDITIVQPGINPDPTWTSVSNVVSPYTLTGLRSGTSYMAVVRSLCDIDSYGEWSEPILFTTESGNAFFTDGNWNEGANWSCATVPTGNDVDVIIAADAIIPAGYVAVVNDIEITGGGSITIEDGGQLVANCNVFATIKKNIIGYGAYNTNTNLGYYLIALPTTIGVSPSNIGLLTTPAESYDLYSWNRTADYEEWQNYKQGSFSLYNEMGYLYANVNDVEMSITGTLRRSNSNVLWTPPYDSDHHGFNLYGNPFPCNAHIIGRLPYYKMNANGNGFEIVSGWVTIAPMEGFFLESTGENQNRGIERDYSSSKGSQSGQINIKLSQNTSTSSENIDNVLVVFEDRETEGVGKLVFNENSSRIVLPREGKDYGALFAQSSGELPVSFVAKTDGSFTLSFVTEGVSFSYLHLIDNVTGEDVDLLDDAALRQAQGPQTYTFEAHAGDPVSRFTIVYEVR